MMRLIAGLKRTKMIWSSHRKRIKMKKQKLIEQYPIEWPEVKIKEFRRVLMDWYDANRRDLPWRQTSNPYFIWVSEIMLQQTQVRTVIPYYETFIEELPTIKALSEVTEEKLLKLWQGLGYYSRVRNMQTAAKQIVEDYNGKMPDTVEGLLTLKGIGPYTAGAIASIAYGIPEPALDGNLMRVVSRLFEIDSDISLTRTRNQFMSILYQLIDPDRPGDFNQALMDIGAGIMTPSNPQPEDHPLEAFDQSYQNGTSHLYPVKKKKTKVTEHNMLAFAILNQKNEWLLRQHTSDELLSNLWHFPLVEADLVMENISLDELLNLFIEKYGSYFSNFNVEDIDPAAGTYNNMSKLSKVTHIFSHRKWQLQIVPLKFNQNKDFTKATMRWAGIEELEILPISTLQEKLFKGITVDRI